LPLITQLLYIGINLGSTAPGAFAETAQTLGRIFGFRAQDNLVALYDSG
jgi:hypothetical protein